MSEGLPADWDEWDINAKNAFVTNIKYNWSYWARPDQRPPEDDEWDIWFLSAGRGFGKTRTGAEFIRDRMENIPGCRIGIIGQTTGAARDVCVEGESGLINVTPPELIHKYNRSLGQVHFKNGSMAFTFSGSDPEKLRGFQSHYLWLDELCAFQYADATFDMGVMGLRLGKHPRMVITSTPKPSKLIVELVNRSREEPDKVRLTTGSTFANSANLPQSTLDSLRARYEGTTMGRQELYAEIILDDPDALWSRAIIDASRVDKLDDAKIVKVIIGVDPSMSQTTKRSTETGIVVGALGIDGHAYILEDASMLRPSPDDWANRIVDKYNQYRANRVVAEVNQGYDLVVHTIHTVDDTVPVKKVYASRAKQPRAEPIAALHEQKRIHFVGNLPGLEDQLTSWVPGNQSPDRLDAFVWCMTELMLGGGMSEFFSPSAAGSLPKIV